MKLYMKRILVASVCLLFSSVFAHAQGFGSVVGTVIDPSGAVVTGATVTATEVHTSFTRSATTNAQGYFVLSSLRPAQYTLSVTARGFRTFTQKELSLLADQTLTVNPKLELGTASEIIEVTGNATQVDTSTATLKQVIEQARLLELPLNGRNAAQLTLGVPGAVSTPDAGADQGATKTIPGAVTISTNGSRQNMISYQLDGGNNVDEYTNVNQPFPFPDALQEFSVQTSNYSAQYGQNAGAVVNVVTRSGGNTVHGDLFEFNRNAVYNARNFFADTRDQLKRNQFGGTVGGPIIRDRTFFFAGYQGTRLRNVGSTSNATVPTQAQINAVGAAIDPASRKVLNFLPKTSDPNGQVFFNRPDRQNFEDVVGKVDHSLRQNDRLSLRYYYVRFHKDAIFEPTNILTYTDGSTIPSQNYLIHEAHTFGTSLLNDFRFSFSREAAARGPADGVPSVRDFGVNIPFQPARNAIQTVNAAGGQFSFGDNPDARFTRNNFSWSDDVGWVRGRHDLRFGGTLERSRVDIDNLFQQPGEFRFNSCVPNPLNPCFGGVFDNFLRGILGGNPGFRQGAGEFKNNRNIFAGLYIQDNFRISRRLTLNAGLRWEPTLPWREIKGRVEQFRMNDFFANQRSTQFINAPPGLFFPGDPGVPQNGTSASLNNFAPRVGLAYDLFGDGKTSLRAGAGIFYDSRTVGIFNNRFVDVTPFSTQLTIASPNGPFSDPLRGVTNPFPVAFPPPSNIAFPLPTLAVTYDPSRKYLTPTLYNWNLSIEREIFQGWLVRVAYVGSHSSHLRESVELNPASVASGTSNLDSRRRLNRVFPSAACTALVQTGCLLSNISLDGHDVNSSYNALQISFERQLAHGVTILANYTYSKSIDDLPYGYNGAGVADLGADAVSALPWDDPNRHQFDRGPTDFDHTHRFGASFVVPLPDLTGSSPLIHHALGGWKVTGLVSAQTGRPFTAMSGLGAGSDRSQVGLGRDRAVIAPGNPYGTGGCAATTVRCVDFLNVSLFSQPAVGTFGNASKGSLRWPGFYNWDMGFTKDFRVTERWSVQFRAEFFNIFNRVNYRDTNNSGFGNTVENASNVSARNFGTLRSALDPRIGQLALKVIF